MSDHYTTIRDLPQGGERLEASRVGALKGFLGLVGGLGLLFALWVFVAAETELRQQFAYSWLFGFYFFFTIAVGSLFWVLLHHASNSGWGIAIRRLFENVAVLLPWFFILALPFLLVTDVRHALWDWMIEHGRSRTLVPGAVSTSAALHYSPDPHHHLLYAKYGYLNLPFWVVRFFLYFVVLGGMALLLRRMSLAQELDGHESHTFEMRGRACVMLPFFAVAITFIAIDWLMALDYSWFSTMFGVQLFAGSALSAMAFMILLVSYLRGQGHLRQVISPEHYHLMGKLTFAFTVFWAYISFSQFFLIWYANITEETRYFLLRNTEGWHILSYVLVFGHFAVPFLAFISVPAKKSAIVSCLVAGYILFVHALDLYFCIIPERGPTLSHGELLIIPGAWVYDLVALVTIGGVMGFLLLRVLGTASLYPWRDPRIQESVNVHN
jgi:hypothetical protein